MSWWLIVLLALAIYLSIGVAMTFFLMQTPYAENPLWMLLLLWPLFLLG